MAKKESRRFEEWEINDFLRAIKGAAAGYRAEMNSEDLAAILIYATEALKMIGKNPDKAVRELMDDPTF